MFMWKIDLGVDVQVPVADGVAVGETTESFRVMRDKH